MIFDELTLSTQALIEQMPLTVNMSQRHEKGKCSSYISAAAAMRRYIPIEGEQANSLLFLCPDLGRMSRSMSGSNVRILPVNDCVFRTAMLHLN